MYTLDLRHVAPLRCTVRVKGNSGFLFVNNFQDHIAMRDPTDEAVRLHLPQGDVTFRSSASPLSRRM